VETSFCFFPTVMNKDVHLDDNSDDDERVGLLEDSRQNGSGIQLAQHASEICNNLADDALYHNTVDGVAHVGDQPEAAQRRGSVQHVFFSMTPREARLIMQHQRRSEKGPRNTLRSDAQEHDTSSGHDLQPGSNANGRMVLDPCLGRWEIWRAKGGFCCVIIAAIVVALALLQLGHVYLRYHLNLGAIPVFQTFLFVCLAIPLAFLGVLCALEHAEWLYLRKVAPRERLSYTPALHSIMASFRHRFSQG